MKRRTFLGAALACATAPPLFASVRGKRWEDAAEVLAQATARRQVDAAVLHVVQRRESFTRHFGKAGSGDAMFLLGSISKPINVTAVMTLFDRGRFQLDDGVKRFLPAFTGDGRDDVTIRHLLTHVSGLPDQVANNAELRRGHAPLTEFAAQAMRTAASISPPRLPSTSIRAWGSCSPRGLRSSSAGRTFSHSWIAPSSDPWACNGRPRGSDGLGWRRWSHARRLAPRPNRGAAIRKPWIGTGTVPTGGGWAPPGAGRTLPHPTSPGSWASSWGHAARS